MCLGSVTLMLSNRVTPVIECQRIHRAGIAVHQRTEITARKRQRQSGRASCGRCRRASEADVRDQSDKKK